MIDSRIKNYKNHKNLSVPSHSIYLRNKCYKMSNFSIKI